MLALIAVLLAFYALWMAVTGRTGAAGSTELNASGRVIVALVALIAFGIAYAAYHPLLYNRPALAAAPVREKAVPVSETPEIRANPMPVGRNENVSAAADQSVEPAVKSVQQESRPASLDQSAPSAAPENSGRLSKSAAAIEAEAGRKPATAELSGVSPAQVSPAAVTASNQGAELPGSAPSPGRLARRPLQIQIENQLGSDQQGERLTLSIEGKAVADIEIDARRPAVVVPVSLPRPGKLHYRLEGLSDDGIGTRLKGEGCIPVDDGARYVVRRKPGSQKVFLERTRLAR